MAGTTIFTESGIPVVDWRCKSPISNPTAIEHVFQDDNGRAVTTTFSNLSYVVVTYSQYSSYSIERLTTVSFLASSTLTPGDVRSVIGWQFEAEYESTDVEVASSWSSIFSARKSEFTSSSSAFDFWQSRREDGLVPLPVEYQYLLATNSLEPLTTLTSASAVDI